VNLGQAEAADGGRLPGSVVVEADDVMGGERRPGGEPAPVREVERRDADAVGETQKVARQQFTPGGIQTSGQRSVRHAVSEAAGP
jgi:hypothetical protein